ncbi:MAG TPA: ATP-binding protein [Longimicrobium sp.]|nr:ATP-binding protein [Longimicrobium sp.]
MPTDPAASEEPGILFARNPVPMWVFDPLTLRILAVNQAAERQYGYSADEFLRLTLTDLRPPEEMERLHAALRRAAESGAVVGRGEARHRRRDGTLLEVEVTTQDIVFRGEPARVAVAVDVTGRARAARRLEALQAVTARLATALTPGEVADAVVGEGVRVLGAHSGSVALLDAARQEVEVVGAVGYPAEALERFRRIPLSAAFPLTDAVRQPEPVFLADAAARDARYPHLAELRRANGGGPMAAVPLLLDGSAIGALGLNFPEDFVLDDEERAFVLSLARQCAQALHRARLYEEERHSRLAAERLQALTEGFSGALTVAQVGEVAMRQGVAALGAYAGVLALRTPAGDEVELLASIGYPEAACMSAGRRWRADASIPIAEATRTGRPVFLESPQAWAAHFRTGHTPPATSASQAWAAVPIALEDGTPGALLWTYDRPHRFEAPERSLVLSISRLCAQAMDRARLYEAERAARAERDHALALAEAARDRLRLVFEQAPVSIVILRGPEHVVESANAAYMATLRHGRRVEELRGRPVRQALPELDGQGFFELLDAVYAAGEPYVGTEVPARIDRDGDGVEEELLYNFVYQPLFGADGAVEGICAVGVDVTELSRARRAAEEANRAKSQFLATMSHELRTPLNAIGGYAQLLEMGIFGPVTEAQRDHLGRIQRSQEHLLGLINNVLNFARIEAGRVQYATEEVPLRQALQGITELILPQARERGVCLHPVECEPELRVRADPEKFRQVVLNLLSNAVKFTPAGGSVTLLASAMDDGFAAVRVRDTGVGIAPERIGEIFDPFVQVGRHLGSRDEGVGLGLSISRDLARGMGGDLTCESVPGHGATFTLTLPLASAEL